MMSIRSLHIPVCIFTSIFSRSDISRFTVTCTFGPVLLAIPKFESLQFAIAKELGKNKQRHTCQFYIIWWRNHTCIVAQVYQTIKEKQKFTDRPVFFVMEVCPKFGCCQSTSNTTLNFLFGS